MDMDNVFLFMCAALNVQFHEIWKFFNGYTWEEHRFEIHR
jgi:hypothetical protein